MGIYYNHVHSNSSCDSHFGFSSFLGGASNINGKLPNVGALDGTSLPAESELWILSERI